MDFPSFNYLRPVFILLNIFLLMTLSFIFIDNKRIKINYFFVISISVLCILTACTLYVQSGFIIDEFALGMDDLSVVLIFSTIGSGILNPFIYKIKINNRKR